MAIHGVAPENGSSSESAPKRKIDENQQKAMDIALAKAKERKRLEFLNKKG